MDPDREELAFDDEAPPPRKGRIIKIGAFLALVALLASAGFLLWKHQTAFSEQEYLKRAEFALQSGQLSAAGIELKNALQTNPRNIQSRLGLAKIYVQLGMGPEAEEQLNRARELGADRKSLVLPLAEVLLLQRKYDKVLQEIKPDEHHQPAEQLHAIRVRADALLGLGRSEEACSLFEKSHEAEPKHVPAYWGLVKCALVKRDFGTAKAHLAAALKLDPHNLHTLMLRGDVAQALGDLHGAEAAYGQVIALDAANIPARLSRASARLAANKLELAGEDVQAAKAHAPDIVMVRYLEALVAYRQDRLMDAQNILLELTAKSDHVPSRVLSGRVAYKLGQYGRANNDLTAALQMLPESRIVRLTLAQTRLKTGQPESALAALGPLLTENLRDTEVLATAGEAYLLMGNQDKGSKYLDKLAALAPGDAALRYKIGLWRLRSGELPGAVRDLEAASRSGALPQEAEGWRVMIHLMRKEHDQALALADDLVKRSPDHAQLYDLQAMAYLGKGDATGARQSFERALKMQPLDVTAARSLALLDMKQGKVAAAKARYEAMLKINPGHYEAMMELAQLAKAQGEDADHVRWLTGAAEAARAETTPRLLLARHFLTKNEPLKALGWARQALDLNPRNPKAMELLGDAQFASGDKDSALYSYLQWTLIDQDSPQAYYKLGKAQLTVSQTISARESMQRVLKRKPDHLGAAMALAMLALQDRRHKVALDLARQIEQHHPKLWQGYSLEGDSHVGMGRFAEAAKVYAQAFAIHPDSGLFIRLHQALTRAGDSQQAQLVQDQWLRQSPNDLAVRLYLGVSHLLAGRAREAEAEYQAALKSAPDNLAALVGMAEALHAQNDARAVHYAELAYEKGRRGASVSDLLGWMLVARGETRRGLDLLRKAEALEPQNPAIRYHLAAALAKTGEQAQARLLLESVLAKGGEFPQRMEAQAFLKTLPAPKAQGRP